MDIAALRTELTDDPLGIGYESMSDPEAAEALNAQTRPSTGTVLASEVRRFVLINGIWPRIAGAAQAHPDPVVQGTAITILQTLAPNSFDGIRMGDPTVAGAVTGMLDTMVSANLMTTGQRDGMIALGSILISRADELGLGRVSYIDIGEARIG